MKYHRSGRIKYLWAEVLAVDTRSLVGCILLSLILVGCVSDSSVGANPVTSVVPVATLAITPVPSATPVADDQLSPAAKLEYQKLAADLQELSNRAQAASNEANALNISEYASACSAVFLVLGTAEMESAVTHCNSTFSAYMQAYTKANSSLAAVINDGDNLARRVADVAAKYPKDEAAQNVSATLTDAISHSRDFLNAANSDKGLGRILSTYAELQKNISDYRIAMRHSPELCGNMPRSMTAAEFSRAGWGTLEPFDSCWAASSVGERLGAATCTASNCSDLLVDASGIILGVAGTKAVANYQQDGTTYGFVNCSQRVAIYPSSMSCIVGVSRLAQVFGSSG